MGLRTIRCVVKVNDETIHDETWVNPHPQVQFVSYPGLRVEGGRIEVGFEFDPPLEVPA